VDLGFAVDCVADRVVNYLEEIRFLERICLVDPFNEAAFIRLDALRNRLKISADIPDEHLGKYKVIIADPAWDYQNWSEAKNGSHKPHYDGMKWQEMAKIPVDKWAHPDNCMIAMWCTWPKMDEGQSLLRSWGFEHVTGCPWVKTVTEALSCKRGTGFWFAGMSEFVIIGRRGKVERLFWETPVGMLCGENRQFYGPIGRHSAKPVAFQSFIAKHFEGPILELFARPDEEEWPGFTRWGLELGYKLTPKGVEECEVPDVSIQGTLF